MTALKYNVTHFAQESDHTCWYASARMILNYFGRLKTTKVAAEITSAVKTNQTINIDRGAMQAVGTSLELAYHSFLAWHSSAEGLRHLLKKSGSPLWFMGKNHGFNGSWEGGHVVVITGIDGKTVYFNDPWKKGQDGYGKSQINDFFTRLSPPSADWAILHGQKL